MHPRQPLPRALEALAERQSGLLTTRQLLDGGLTRAVIGRMARQWVSPAEGLHFLTEPCWLSAAWAGLLRGGDGAVLGEDAAAYLHDAVRDAPSHIAVWTPARRDPLDLGPWVVHYRRGVRSGRGSPSRTSVETSLLDLARVNSEDGTVAAVARALAQGRTTPDRLVTAMDTRRATRHSAVIRDLCRQAGSGIESALEWRFHRQVLVPHRLPHPTRQVRSVVGRADCLYGWARLVVELDGIRDHVEWSKDMERDNARLVLEGAATLRYGWHAVTRDPCGVAAQLATALRPRGWDGVLRRCRRCPG